MHSAADQSDTEPAHGMWDETINFNIKKTEIVVAQSTNAESCEGKKFDAESALNEVFSTIKQKLETGPNRFSEYLWGMSEQHLASAFHSFNSDSTSSALKGPVHTNVFKSIQIQMRQM